MHEYSTPTTYRLPDSGNLTDDVLAHATEHGPEVGFHRRDGNSWHDVTYAEFYADVWAHAKALVAAGVDVGDRVGLVSATRYEWTVLDYAIWFAGAVSVPVYETSSADQIAWILSDSAAVFAVVGTERHRDLVQRRRSDLSALRDVRCLDTGEVAALVAGSDGVADAEIERRRGVAGPADTATIIYTSGTTGRPKGCRLTHGNFMTEVAVATEALEELFTGGASTLLFLPLAHVFARVIAIGCIHRRVRLGHSADIKRLMDDLAVLQPTFLLAVPRVFEKVFNGASQQAAASGRRRVFDAAASTAVAFSQAADSGGPGLGLRLRHRLFDTLVYAKLRAGLGGHVTHAISGGAPLGERMLHFFRGIGVPVLEGYGLTETTAALSVNLPGDQRIGTVGRPLPGTSVRVSSDGELLFRGGQVFPGYWNNEAATTEALQDGWLRTGDLGEIDDGFVRITGRQKEILVTAGGKNVAPAVLEDLVRAHPLVSQCMVVGDARPFVAALVTLDSEALAPWAEANGKPVDPATLARDPDIRQEVQQAVDTANARVSRAESIRKFTVLGSDWSEDSGEVTPTMKLRRSVVMRNCHDEIEALYV